MKFKSAKVILASALGFGVSVPAFAAGLKDTNIPWAQSAIEKFVANGAVAGYPDHTFRPNNPISRAEFTTIINKAFGKLDPEATANFKDVKSNQWFYKQVASAKEAGYVTGFPNNTFAPNKSITRAEAAVMVAKLLHLDTTNASANFKDTNLPQWAAASINALGDLKVLNGYTDGYFRASNYITRAEATVMLNTALSPSQQPAPTTTDTIQVGIKGAVTLDGKAVAGADVKAFKAGDYALLKEATTDNSGNFKFDVAADGSYYVTAVKDNMVGYASDVTTTKDKGASVSIKLDKGVQVSGRLLDTYGNVLQNVTYAFNVDGASFTGVTDSSGNYKILLPINKTYSLSVVNPQNTTAGLQSINNTVTIGNTDQTMNDMRTTFAASTGGGGGGGSSYPGSSQKSFSNTQISASDLNGVTEADITGGTVTLNGNMPSGVNFVLTNGATLQATNGTVTIPGNVTMDSNSTLSGIKVQGTTTIQ